MQPLNLYLGLLLKRAFVVMSLCGAPSFGLHAAEDASQLGGEVINVYTAFVPPYAQPETDGAISGTLIPIVERYLSARGINYKMTLQPWSASYKRTLTGSHALLFPVDRTPEREHQFRWIAPLVVNEYYLYGISGSKEAGQSPGQIKMSDALLSCGNNSVQCQLLLNSGFMDKNIVRIEDASVQQRYTLMMHGRNQFTVFDPLVYADLTKRHGLDPSKLVKLFKVGEHSSYLAAGKAMSADLVESLR